MKEEKDWIDSELAEGARVGARMGEDGALRRAQRSRIGSPLNET